RDPILSTPTYTSPSADTAMHAGLGTSSASANTRISKSSGHFRLAASESVMAVYWYVDAGLQLRVCPVQLQKATTITEATPHHWNGLIKARSLLLNLFIGCKIRFSNGGKLR